MVIKSPLWHIQLVMTFAKRRTGDEINLNACVLCTYYKDKNQSIKNGQNIDWCKEMSLAMVFVCFFKIYIWTNHSDSTVYLNFLSSAVPVPFFEWKPLWSRPVEKSPILANFAKYSNFWKKISRLENAKNCPSSKRFQRYIIFAGSCIVEVSKRKITNKSCEN